MENLHSVLEENTIKTFLKRFPKSEWTEALTKALKFGIHSMTTVESFPSNPKSPKRKSFPNPSHFEPPSQKSVRTPKSISIQKLTPKSKPNLKTEPKKRLRFSSARAKNSLKSLILPFHTLQAFDHPSKPKLEKSKHKTLHKHSKANSKTATLAYITSSSDNSP